jgi:SAM-dependent methyltransferase
LKAQAQSPWDGSNYRGPEHPVPAAFARGKLDALDALLEKRAPERARRPSGPTPRVLDLGAGPGIFSVPLEARHPGLVALDFDPAMLRRNPARRRVLGDCLRLPFGGGVFDLVFEANLLHHVDDPTASLREARRVLKPDGLLVCVEPNALNPLMALFGLIARHERGLLRFNPGRLPRLGTAAGLRLLARMTAGWIFQNTTPTWALGVLLPLERWNCPLGGYQIAVFERDDYVPGREGRP